MHRFIAMALAAGAGSAFLGCRSPTSAPSLPTLAVVRTDGELLKQTPIDIGDGVSVKLGVSASHAPVNSGILIYCMSDNYDAMRGHEANLDRLGPLWVSTRRGEQCFDSTGTYGCSSRWAWQTTEGCTLLFTRGLVIDKPGDYQVVVRTEAGKVVAQATIKADNEFYHPWTPFVMHEEGEWEWISRRDYAFKQTKFGKMSIKGVGLALPDWHGNRFQVVAGDAVLGAEREHFQPGKPETPLPPLIPETPTREFELSRQDDLLFIDPKGQIESYRPDWRCLARLWVNDRPFVPQAGRAEEILKSGTVHWDTRVGFHLEIDQKAIGVVPGDRVAIQILFCPAWRYVENPPTSESAGSGSPRLTNRVEWVVK